MGDYMLISKAFYYGPIPYPGEIHPQDIGQVYRDTSFIYNYSAFVFIFYIAAIILLISPLYRADIAFTESGLSLRADNPCSDYIASLMVVWIFISVNRIHKYDAAETRDFSHERSRISHPFNKK